MSVYEAATNNQSTKLRALLAYGHAVNEVNQDGWTPLCSAVTLTNYALSG
jgi:hypothetical protein